MLLNGEFWSLSRQLPSSGQKLTVTGRTRLCLSELSSIPQTLKPITESAWRHVTRSGAWSGSGVVLWKNYFAASWRATHDKKQHHFTLINGAGMMEKTEEPPSLNTEEETSEKDKIWCLQRVGRDCDWLRLFEDSEVHVYRTKTHVFICVWLYSETQFGLRLKEAVRGVV